MNRTNFIAGGRALCLALLAVGCLTACQRHDTTVSAWPRGDRPNILLIVTDDQRWDQLGVAQAERAGQGRFPFLETPRLDALAAQGTRFRNAFVTTSLCSPSRSSLLTGQYAHSHGIIDNYAPFNPKPTWATALREAGYTTAYFGKWHHGTQAERPGFDYVATFLGQGNYYNTPFLRGEAGARRMIGTNGYIDARSVDALVEYLENPRPAPFAAVLGLKGVHQPFTPMEEHAGSYADRQIPPPANWKSLPYWSPLQDTPPRKAPRGQVWTSILETVRGVDANVGRVVDALDRLDLADNTLLIFTSDNGYYFGEHSLADKRSAYEESIRVPMIVRLPGAVPAGEVSDALVLNIDVAPTILDFAGAAVPDRMQGNSLRRLFTREAGDWREDFLYEYWQLPFDARKLPDADIAKFGVLRLNTPTMLALRTPRYKLVTYLDRPDATELYDLEVDPLENVNRAQDSDLAGLREQLCRRLAALAAETGYSYTRVISRWLAESPYPYTPENLLDSLEDRLAAGAADVPGCRSS